MDAATGETIYLGGTTSASGTARQNVARRATARVLFPRIRSGCSSPLPQNHGSGTLERDGTAVQIPPLGEGDPPSRRSDGGQGRRDFPRSGFGGPRDPLRRGGCDSQTIGTPRDDRLTGDGGGNLIFGLPGADRLSGRGDDDCLIGGSGRKNLTSRAARGGTSLTGGRGNDVLTGNSGKNRYDAGAGNDVVLAANNRAELVSCGSRAGATAPGWIARTASRGFQRVKRVP